MDISEIRDLIEMISKSKVSKLELEREGFRLKLEKSKPVAKQNPAVVTVAATPPVAQQMQVVPQAESAPVKAPAAAPAPAQVAEPEEEGLVEMTSPFVGTFYRAPSPDADMFVDIGTRVKRGQIMCIVEAMKLMNEIEAEMDCEVVDVLVANGQPVEFGEALFKIRPSK